MMIDALAERYGKLPSEVLDNASTFDLWVYDVAISYRNHKSEQETNKKPELTTEELAQQMEIFRANQSRQA